MSEAWLESFLVLKYYKSIYSSENKKTSEDTRIFYVLAQIPNNVTKVVKATVQKGG